MDRTVKKTLLCLFFALTVPSCAQVASLASSEKEFAFSLSRTIETPNLIVSPYSIFTCLTMTYMGARGDTAAEMEKALFLSLPNKQIPQYSDVLYGQLQGSGLQIANAMWVSPKIFVLANYRRQIEKEFHAEVGTVDFDDPKKATETINEWISEKTQGKIPTLLDSGDLDNGTRIVLTNAIYFSGVFLKPFDPKLTAKSDFFPSSDKKEEVDMMDQVNQFFYCDDEEFQSISMPFKDTTVSCVLLLPKKEIANIEEVFPRLLENQQRTRVHLRIPKFSLTQRFQLNDTLKKLGIIQAFTNEANFSGIDGLRDLYLSKVVHEAFFSIDENGVVAAAATGAAMGLTGVLDKTEPVDLTFDRPFYFWLIDLNTKTIIFTGRYTCNSCH